MSRKKSETLIRKYFTAFSIRDVDGALKLLDELVVHDPGDGPRQSGREAVRAHLERMAGLQASAHDLVIMLDGEGRRGAAEFTLMGRQGEADGRDFAVPAGAFFVIDDGKIVRLTTHLDQAAWRQQLGAGA